MAQTVLQISSLIAKFTSDLSTLILKAFSKADEYAFQAKILSQQFFKMIIETPEGKKKYVYDFEMPGFAVDLLKFSYDNSDTLCALLVKRSKNTQPVIFAGLYAIPGGFLNYGKEDAFKAATREMKEETGTDTVADSGEDTSTCIEIKDMINRIYHLTFASDPERDPRQHTLSEVFTILVKMDDKPLFTNDDEEIAGVHWVPVEKILGDDFKMAFDHKKLIKRAFDMHMYIKSLPPVQQKAVLNVLKQQL